MIAQKSTEEQYWNWSFGIALAAAPTVSQNLMPTRLVKLHCCLLLPIHEISDGNRSCGTTNLKNTQIEKLLKGRWFFVKATMRIRFFPVHTFHFFELHPMFEKYCHYCHFNECDIQWHLFVSLFIRSIHIANHFLIAILGSKPNQWCTYS